MLQELQDISESLEKTVRKRWEMDRRAVPAIVGFFLAAAIFHPEQGALC
jgi:hypothetical protein